MGELINIRGKQIYVEIHGDREKPVLLYLHGGPGSSCFDFIKYQKDRIIQIDLCLVSIDQRGVLRSEPLSHDEDFGLNDLVEDCEELRKVLNIQSWSLLGHSFGAMIALRYLSKYRVNVRKVIFECPSFDLISTLRSNLLGASRIYSMFGKSEEALRCIEAANDSAPPIDILNKWGELGLEGLGKDKDRIFMHALDHTIFNEVYSDCPNHLWDHTQLHFFKLRDEGEIFKNQLPLISNIKMPSLIIKGKYDTVFSQDQEDAYRQLNPEGMVVEFSNSAHFPRIEEPNLYAETICKFISKDKVRASS
jgi:proline iminopeptidase